MTLGNIYLGHRLVDRHTERGGGVLTEGHGHHWSLAYKVTEGLYVLGTQLGQRAIGYPYASTTDRMYCRSKNKCKIKCSTQIQ